MRIILKTIRAFAIAYLIVVVLMMWFENRLIFPTGRIPPGDWNTDERDCDEAYFDSDDGTRLHGWYFHHEAPQAHVLYCHGNAEDVARLGDYMDALRARFQIAIFAFDYRGYGKSDGRPAEEGVIADGLAAQSWLAAHAEIDVQQVVIWGRSIGGAVAIQLAARHGARAVILDRTFTSLPDVASSHFPWLPVQWAMRNRFDSIHQITAYTGPLLQSHGTADEVVPFALGKRLFDAAAARPKCFIALPDVTHNGPNTDEYYNELHVFFAELP